MRSRSGAVLLGFALVFASPVGAQARHRDDRGGYEEGDRYGNGDNGPRQGNDGDQGRCRGNGCRGSFSPGPFDRSPVDIHDNQVCISPDCSSKGKDNQGGNK